MANGQPTPDTPGEVAPARAVWAKARVAEFSQVEYRNLNLTIQRHGERKVAVTQDGALFGYVSKDSTDHAPEGVIVMHFAICRDGNLRCVWSPVFAE